MPPDFVVKNASKIWSRSSGLIPAPYLHTDNYGPAITNTRLDHQQPVPIGDRVHCLHSVYYQIYKQLLQLGSVGEYIWKIIK